MGIDDFDAYMTARDQEYAETLTATLTVEAARAKAKADRERFLPDGFATDGQRFFFAENDRGEVVGSAWLSLADPRTGSPETAWLFDIQVDPAQRRQGYATVILREVEAVVRSLGARSLALNVFGTNTAAIALYEATGYCVASQQMVKRLDGDQG